MSRGIKSVIIIERLTGTVHALNILVLNTNGKENPYPLSLSPYVANPLTPVFFLCITSNKHSLPSKNRPHVCQRVRVSVLTPDFELIVLLGFEQRVREAVPGQLLANLRQQVVSE